HITPWQDGGETNTNNGTLTCPLHHHLIHQGLWTVRLHNGTALYTPTNTQDPHQKDQYNPYHHNLPHPSTEPATTGRNAAAEPAGCRAPDQQGGKPRTSRTANSGKA
ncbi:HNH endonuclease, partial [Arthrobacter sp. STN4]